MEVLWAEDRWQLALWAALIPCLLAVPAAKAQDEGVIQPGSSRHVPEARDDISPEESERPDAPTLAPVRPSPKRPRPYRRPCPTPAELLRAKRLEHRSREMLSDEGLTGRERVTARVQLVQALELAGEDPLPAFRVLCDEVASVGDMGPKVAWNLARENIARLYEERYFDECRRYCRAVLDSEWADDEARAWATLRVVCIEKLTERWGAFLRLSRHLMETYPQTAAARVHTEAAVYWLISDGKSREALDVMAKMMKLHSGDTGYVLSCVQDSYGLAVQLKSGEDLERLRDVLQSVRKDEDAMKGRTRAHVTRRLGRIDAQLRRIARKGTE